MTNPLSSIPEPDDQSQTINTQAVRRVAGAMTPLIWMTLILILSVASVLRFTGLDKEGRWGDEYRQTRSYTLPPRYVVQEAGSAGQPPLDYLIGWALAKIEQSDRMRRIPAAFFGVIGIAALFLLLRRLDSPQSGLIAAALLALSPLHWALSQEARPYTIATTAMILTFWALARALDRPDLGRLITFGAVCYAFTLTRGLLPLVVVCAIGLVLSSLWLFHRCTETDGLRQALQALKRVWLVTFIVAVATIPLVLYLLIGEGFTIFSEEGKRTGEALGASLGTRLTSNAAGWAPLPATMFGATFPLVIGLAIVGAVGCIRRRAAMLPGVRDSLGGACFRPEGALDCSHGWSPAQPDATRGSGTRVDPPRRGGGSALDQASSAPPGRLPRRVRFHGLRFARLAASSPPPVATFLGPSGTVPQPPKLSRRLSPGVGCVLAVMIVVGPLYLLAFSISVPVAPIRMRYGLFLTPILALFAAMALAPVLQWLRDAAANRAFGKLGATLATLVIVAGPAAKTLALSGKYFRPDWRGCAAYLADRVTGDDVVLVHEDRPVHESRMTFWGKYDWPLEMKRPLAEPIRSLALSESHWNRLCRKTGRSFIVIRYQVGVETRDEYLSLGLQKVPPHVVLTKFRGLDLLERLSVSDDPIARMIDACDDLLALPKQNGDADAFLYALRSRLLLHAGDLSAAVESFERAQRIVPGELRSWFVEQLAVHTAALSQATTVAESVELVPFGYPVTRHDASR